MICKYCGTVNDENNKFCAKCGKELEGEKNMNKKSKNKVMGIVGAVIAAIACIWVVMTMQNTINLNDYVKITAEGTDGYATVSATIDWDSIEEKYGSKLSYTTEAKNTYGGLLSFASPIDVLKYSVTVQVDKADHVSNGDIITYSFNVSESDVNNIKTNLKYTNGTYTVDGLEEVETFDAFDNLKVSTSGINGKAALYLEYTGDEFESYDFKADKTTNLSNGDNITITLDDVAINECIQNYGKAPAESTYEYTVQNLGSLINDLSSINEDSLASMKEAAEKTIDEYATNSISSSSNYSNESLDGYEYVGVYMNKIKGETFFSDDNDVYLVYKVNVRDTYQKDDYTYDQINSFYQAIKFENVIADTKGNVTNNLDDNNLEYGRVTFSIDSGEYCTWYYTGFETIEDFKTRVQSSYYNFYE